LYVIIKLSKHKEKKMNNRLIEKALNFISKESNLKVIEENDGIIIFGTKNNFLKINKENVEYHSKKQDDNQSIISLFFLKSIIEKIQKLDEKLSETSKEYFLFNAVTIWEQLEHDAKLSDVRINEIFKKVQGENDDSEL
jgi:hypothetical protein